MTAAVLPIPDALLGPLEEGLSHHVGGEVVVRTPSGTGRVFLYSGSVAWVTCDSVKVRLVDVLRERAGLRSTDLAAALEECKKTGGNFAETLLRWGLLERDNMRACLLRHNAHHLLNLARLEGSMRAMYVPQSRRYSSDFLFGLDELMEAAGGIQRESEPPPLPEPTVQIQDPPLPGADTVLGTALRKAYEAFPGAVLVAVVDLRTGTAVGAWPPTALEGGAASILLGEAVRQLLTVGPLSRLTTALQSGRARELVLQDGELVLLARHATLLPGHALVAGCITPRSLGWALGVARMVLKGVEEALALPGGS